MPSRGLIDPMSRTAFDAFQDLGESERPDQPKDRMRMIGHYHRRIEIDGVFVQRSNLSHYEAARFGWQFESV